MKAKNTIIFLFGFFCFFSSYPAWSLQFDVTRTDDPTPDGCNSGVDCSLREAVIAANANGGTDTHKLPDETYQLTIPEAGNAASGDLDYDGSGGSLTIQGAGENLTFIEADPALASRLIQTTNDADLTISNPTMRKGEDHTGG